jgi:hypothetical protein
VSNDVNAKMKINNQSSKFGEMLDRNEYPRCTQSKYIQEYIIIYYILIYIIQQLLKNNNKQGLPAPI